MPIRKSHRTERSALMISIIIHLFAYFLLLVWMGKWVIESDEYFGFMKVDFLKIKNLEVRPRKRPNMPITRLAALHQKETAAPSEGGSQVDITISAGTISPLPIKSDEQKIPGTVSPVIGFGISSPNNTLPVPIWSHGQKLWDMQEHVGAKKIRPQRSFRGAPADRGRHETLFRLIEQKPEELRDVNLGMTNFLGNEPRRQRVVYCLDVSASMYQPQRKIAAAVAAVKGSMRALHSSSWFNIILFASQVKAMNSRLLPVNPKNFSKASKFLDEHLGQPLDFYGTDILAALHEASQSRPTEIILVTDGMSADNPQAPGSIEINSYIISTRLKAYNLSHARLYTIGLGVSENSFAARFLQRLAAENGGMCKLLPLDEL